MCIVNFSHTIVPSVRIDEKGLPIRPNSKRSDLFSCSIGNRRTPGASIEPQHEWSRLSSTTRWWLNQPVKQCSPSLFIHCHIPRVLSEANVLWLTRQLGDPISLLIFKIRRSTQTHKEEEEKDNGGYIMTHASINQTQTLPRNTNPKNISGCSNNLSTEP